MAEGEEEKIVVTAESPGDEEKRIVLVGAGDEEKRIIPVGAGDDEEKKFALVGAGNDGEEMRNDGHICPPPGFRFKPKHKELVMYYLLPKLQGREHVPNDNIIEDNVYQCHPEKLIDKYRKRGEDSWYFLSPRARKYRNGNRPSRSTEDKSGRWKASTGKKKEVSEDGGGKTTKSCPSTVLMVAGDGKTEYLKSTLSYFQGPIKGEKKSKWLMKELTIPEFEKKPNKNGGCGKNDTLDEYVMCRIYETNRHKGDDDEAGPSGTQSEPSMSGQATTTAGPAKLSEKQAGKRPAVEKPASKRARRDNPDRLHLGPPAPAPLHGNGVQAPFRAPGYCAGGPGRPMGYHARAPMSQQPLVYHNGQPAFNGQWQVPRQPMAYNSQVPVPRQQGAYSSQGQVPRQPVAHNGQVPVPRQQVTYNSQAPVPRQQVAHNDQVTVPRQQVACNGQVMRAPVQKLSPPFRPAGTPNSCGQNQNQTMMPRSPYPAGQAVNPPSSVVPRPAQTQQQQETAEMRRIRVYRQHIEEFNRLSQSSMQPPASTAHAAQQQRPTAFTHQQQLPTASTHQQQRPMMASTQQQQRPMMASTQEQQRRRTMMSSTQQQRPIMASTQRQQQRTMMASTQDHQRTTMAFTQHQQQQPSFGAYQHHHAGGMAHQFSLENFNASEAAQDYQPGRMFLPATSGCAGASAGSLVSSVVCGAGAGATASGANRDCSNDVNMEFVESATEGGNASSADGDGPKYDSAQ